MSVQLNIGNQLSFVWCGYTYLFDLKTMKGVLIPDPKVLANCMKDRQSIMLVGEDFKGVTMQT